MPEEIVGRVRRERRNGIWGQGNRHEVTREDRWAQGMHFRTRESTGTVLGVLSFAGTNHLPG